VLNAPVIPFDRNHPPRLREPGVTPEERRLATSIVRLYRVAPQSALTIERVIKRLEEKRNERGGVR
jgi:hypothetical protein